MVAWDGPGKRKTRTCVRQGTVVACVLTLLIFVIWPGPVEAKIIVDDPRQTYADILGPFLHRLTLSQVALDASACNLTSVHAEAGSGPKNGAGTSNSGLPAPSASLGNSESGRPLEALAENGGLDRMAWVSDSLSPNARQSNDNISDLDQVSTRMVNIRTRVTNVGVCLDYFQYLLRMTEDVFSPPRGNTVFALISKSVTEINNTTSVTENNSTTSILFANTGIPQANSSDFAVVFSGHLSNNGLLNTYATTPSARDNKLSISSIVGADKPINPPKKLRIKVSVKEQLRELIIDIFSHVYTYVLISAFIIISLYVNIKL